MNYIKKQADILAKIEKAKEQLEKLEAKRKDEIAVIAMKYNLHELSDSELEKGFKGIAEEKNLVSSEESINQSTS